ncbi:hypothetical protein D3C86_2188880 [compost metagenome]
MFLVVGKDPIDKPEDPMLDPNPLSGSASGRSLSIIHKLDPTSEIFASTNFIFCTNEDGKV